MGGKAMTHIRGLLSCFKLSALALVLPSLQEWECYLHPLGSWVLCFLTSVIVTDFPSDRSSRWKGVAFLQHWNFEDNGLSIDF